MDVGYVIAAASKDEHLPLPDKPYDQAKACGESLPIDDWRPKYDVIEPGIPDCPLRLKLAFSIRIERMRLRILINAVAGAPVDGSGGDIDEPWPLFLQPRRLEKLGCPHEIGKHHFLLINGVVHLGGAMHDGIDAHACIFEGWEIPGGTKVGFEGFYRRAKKRIGRFHVAHQYAHLAAVFLFSYQFENEGPANPPSCAGD